MIIIKNISKIPMRQVSALEERQLSYKISNFLKDLGYSHSHESTTIIKKTKYKILKEINRRGKRQ